jgi:hypothetical protein
MLPFFVFLLLHMLHSWLFSRLTLLPQGPGKGVAQPLMRTCRPFLGEHGMAAFVNGIDLLLCWSEQIQVDGEDESKGGNRDDDTERVWYTLPVGNVALNDGEDGPAGCRRSKVYRARLCV